MKILMKSKNNMGCMWFKNISFKAFQKQNKEIVRRLQVNRNCTKWKTEIEYYLITIPRKILSIGPVNIKFYEFKCPWTIFIQIERNKHKNK